MIIYGATKSKFLDDILRDEIENVILANYKRETGGTVGKSEIASWRNSLQRVSSVLHDDEIPSTTGVFIEYHIAQTSKRVDLMVSGHGADQSKNIVLVELKQWTEAEVTDMDAVVITRLGGGRREAEHPSYQAWSYAALMRDYNEAVYEGDIRVHPCAYAHNFEHENVLDNPFYEEHTQRAPLFMKGDGPALRDFIKQFIKHGDDTAILYELENGRIRPSKVLADRLGSMLKGNREFIMIDDQKIIYERAMALAKRPISEGKHVFIVEGGPGTGKSVVAVNLLVAASKVRMNSQYVTKNAAPRSVYEKKLTGTFRKTEISNLFTGSGRFTRTAKNTFDLLVVDEAHRLNEKSGLYQNMGDNQVKEVINSAKTTVFFLDEDQRVTLSDIGSRKEIEEWAVKLGAAVHHGALSSQFRCNGSDGYLAWIDNALGIRKTANWLLNSEDFDFRVFDSPTELKEHIYALNVEANKARMVAGYCWDWKSKSNPLMDDIVLPEYGFSAKWNLTKDGGAWIISESSLPEVGCIHTCQGLEVDHIGVIIGDDLQVRNGEIITNGLARSSMDNSVKGFKQLFKRNAVEAQALVAPIIKNTYRTLLTRGMKSCSVYATDPETRQYFRGLLNT